MRMSLRLGLINAFDADGFWVGWDTPSIAWGVTYHYVAWNAAPGGLVLGDYTGNGQASQSIGGVGFKPEWVLVKTGEAWPAVQKPEALGGDKSGFVTPVAFTTQGIRSGRSRRLQGR